MAVYFNSDNPRRSAELRLCLAAESGRLHEVRKYIESGVDVNCKNDRCSTPLILSAGNSDAVLVTECLLTAGADVDLPLDDLRMTALHVACKDQNIEAVKLLLQNGANPYLLDANGRSVLHYAAAGSSTKLMRKLIKRTRGKLVDHADESGYTPLMVACESGQLDIVMVLLEHNADASLRNRLHHQALELADWFGHRVVTTALSQYMQSKGLTTTVSPVEPTVPASPALSTNTPMPGLMSPTATPTHPDGSHPTESMHHVGASDPVGAALQAATSTVPFAAPPVLADPST